MTDKTRQQPEQEANQDERHEQRQPLRYNPRLVFGDPDTFFLDLLAEQCETM